MTFEQEQQIIRRFQKWALWQLVAFIALTCAGFFIKTFSYLHDQTDPDLYAHHWSFQAFMFGIFILPPLVLGLWILLGVEW